MLSLSKLARMAVLGVVIATLTLPVRAADLDKLAPADSEAAVVVNIKAFLDSKLFQKYGKEAVDKALKNQEAAEVIKATGLDPLKDLDSITVTFTGGKADPKGCVIVKGNFNVAKLQTAIKDAAKKENKEVKETTDGGLTYFTMPAQGKEVSGTFIGTNSFVISNNLDYLKLIAKGKKLEATDAAKTLKGVVGHAGGKETIFLAVAITDEMKKAMANSQVQQLKMYADKVNALSGSINVGDAIDVGLGIATTDGDTAKGLGQLIKQSIPLLKFVAAANEQAAPIANFLADNIKVSWEGKAISLKIQLTEEAMKKLRPGQ